MKGSKERIEFEKIKRNLEDDIKKLTSPEGYLWAGYPHFKTLFGRDSLISAWQLLGYDPRIAKATLSTLARYQGKRVHQKREEEPGKILHEHRTSREIRAWRHKFAHFNHWGFPYYGSADSTLLFVILAHEYKTYANDTKTVKRFWPHVKRALAWIWTFGDPDGDGFIEYERKNPWGLYHQGWRDSTENHLRVEAPVALVEIQGYAYLALALGSRLAESFGEKMFAARLRGRAERLKKKFNGVFWNRDHFIFALDKYKKRNDSIASNQGHLLFTGIVSSREKEKKLIKRLFARDMWTPYGIRTLATSDPHFNPLSYHLGSVWPHDNWIIYKGLRDRGYSNDAKKITRALLRAFREIGYLPEYYIVKDNKIAKPYLRRACHPQAWTSGALLNMLLEL